MKKLVKWTSLLMTTGMLLTACGDNGDVDNDLPDMEEPEDDEGLEDLEDFEEDDTEVDE